jgi:dTDP-4-amino-4,6-dideoxygalactose transaminase
MINVTQSFLPPREVYDKYIDSIWERNWLTNHGPLVLELESKLKKHLDVKHLAYVANGTLALQIAIKALDLQGEIITTPFSYIATTSSIVWEGCVPIFADIDSETFNIDPSLIESLITKKTTAILATHVFGNPCSIDTISKIAKKHKLKVIYDAAHAFGVKYKGKSIFEQGDISTTSFHSTKLFHTVEGGAIFTRDEELDTKARLMLNFGHQGPEEFKGVGINAKNSEFHAAMGLSNITYVSDIIGKRKIAFNRYMDVLQYMDVRFQKIKPETEFNYSYFPILFRSKKECDQILNNLRKNNIYARRYFYPSLNKIPYLQNDSITPCSEDIASRIICLPLSYCTTEEDIWAITQVIRQTLKKK